MGRLIINNDFTKLNAKETAYKVIKNNIINLNLKPGERINEKEFEKSLGMSRTPIRDAFSRLTSEGLLDVYPQSGTYISKIDLEKVKEAVFLRSTIEIEAVKRACENFNEEDFVFLDSNFRKQKFAIKNNKLDDFRKFDNEMHEYFFVGNGFKHTWKLVNNFSFDYHRIRKLKLDLNFRTEETLKEHEEIINFIEQRDKKKAVKQIKQHIEYVYEDLEVIRNKYPGYFLD